MSKRNCFIVHGTKIIEVTIPSSFGDFSESGCYFDWLYDDDVDTRLSGDEIIMAYLKNKGLSPAAIDCVATLNDAQRLAHSRSFYRENYEVAESIEITMDDFDNLYKDEVTK